MREQAPWKRPLDGVPGRPLALLNGSPREATLGQPSRRTPAWAKLIVHTLAGLALLALTEILVPAGASRVIIESLVVVFIFSGMSAWVRANRGALTRLDECEYEPGSLELRDITPSRYPVNGRAEAPGSTGVGDRRRRPIRLSQRL